MRHECLECHKPVSWFDRRFRSFLLVTTYVHTRCLIALANQLYELVDEAAAPRANAQLGGRWIFDLSAWARVLLHFDQAMPYETGIEVGTPANEANPRWKN